MHSLETPDTLTVCEPCQHCWVLMASAVLECSCYVPLLRILMCNDPFIPLDYMVYQLKYDSVHGRFNGTIAMSERIARSSSLSNATATRGSGCHRLGNHWFRFFKLVFGQNLQITTTSSIHWFSLGTLLLVFSCPRTFATHTSSSSFQTTTSSRSARWLRSLTCCKCGIRRMAHEPHTPRLHRHLGEPFLCSFAFCFLWVCLFRHSFRHEKDTKCEHHAIDQRERPGNTNRKHFPDERTSGASNAFGRQGRHGNFSSTLVVMKIFPTSAKSQTCSKQVNIRVGPRRKNG